MRSIDMQHLATSFRSAVEEIRGECPDFDESTSIKAVGVDSLDLIEVGMLFEEEFDVEFGEVEFEGLETVGDLLRLFSDLLDDQ